MEITVGRALFFDPRKKKMPARKKSTSRSRSPCKARKSATCRKRDKCTWVKGSPKHKPYCRKGSRSRSPPCRRRSPSPRRRTYSPRRAAAAAAARYSMERRMTPYQRSVIAAYRGPGMPAFGVAGTRGLSVGGSACIPLPKDDCRRHTACEWLEASPNRAAGCRRKAWGARRTVVQDVGMPNWVREQYLAERAARAGVPAAPPLNPVSELLATAAGIPQAPPM
jgi:hypothetical protein